jgi:hypothetical protein
MKATQKKKFETKAHTEHRTRRKHWLNLAATGAAEGVDELDEGAAVTIFAGTTAAREKDENFCRG